MKRIAYVPLCAVVGGVCSMWAQSATDVMGSFKKTSETGTMGTQARMVVRKAGKTVNTLVLKQYTRYEKSGEQKTLIEFLSPLSVKGTRFLSLQKKDGAWEQYLYLPKLARVRSITGGDAHASFMGTDFSYHDLSLVGGVADLDECTLDGTESYEGKMCVRIQTLSHKPQARYVRELLWIEQETGRFVKGEFFDKKDKRVKIMTLSDYETIQGVDTPKTVVLETIAQRSTTTIHLMKVEYHMDIPEKVFTPEYLTQTDR